MFYGLGKLYSQVTMRGSVKEEYIEVVLFLGGCKAGANISTTTLKTAFLRRRSRFYLDVIRLPPAFSGVVLRPVRPQTTLNLCDAG